MSIPSLDIPWQSLYPFQRSGMTSLQSANWNGQERHFVVQWHEDRAYFQLEGEATMWATLDSCAEGDALKCWREALHHRRWGVCFPSGVGIPNGRGYFFWNLHFIYAPDGTGFLREWSSPDWIYFAPRETRAWCLFPELTLPCKDDMGESYRCCQYAARSVRNDLLLRTVSQQEIERLTWKSATTETEFRRVMRWLWDANFLTVEEHYHPYASIDLSTYYAMKSSFNSSVRWWAGSEPFLTWLQSYFVGEGFEWRQTDWGRRRFRKLRAREPHLRVFLKPCAIIWEFPLAQCSAPTFHEQIEARFQLRDWLQEKAPDADIEAWLSPQT